MILNFTSYQLFTTDSPFVQPQFMSGPTRSENESATLTRVDYRHNWCLIFKPTNFL